MTEMRSFRSLAEAHRFMETEIDRPVTSRITNLHNGLELRVSVHDFGDGTFTNIYDLSWDPRDAHAAIRLSSRPVTGLDLAQDTLATSSAAFFVLADQASGLPPQTSLNLAIEHGRVLSLPVVDREALLCRDGILSTTFIAAEGRLTLNQTELTWTGSLTGRDAQCHVYGNGNTVITHQKDPTKGSVRVLEDASRHTPPMPVDSPWVDFGFQATNDGGFRSSATARQGGLDIFAHDLVVRCPAQHADLQSENQMNIISIGSLRAGAFPEYAATVGPSLDTPDFAAHPINQDRSLGAKPPFTNERNVRMAFFHDLQGRTHIRLFDGRPSSPSFQGVTPAEARGTIAAGIGYQSGCFLDGGQTAKLWIMEDGNVTSYGNRHYLRYPQKGSEEFTWVPDVGRPVSSFITFQPRQSIPLDLSEGRGQHVGPAAEAVRLTKLAYPHGWNPPSRQPAAAPQAPAEPKQPRYDHGLGR